MDFTSERVSPEQYQNSLEDYLIFIGHEQNYRHILDACHGKTVLDYGCGDGYGAHILSSAAKSVTAVDVFKDSIETARRKYVKDNLTFDCIAPIEKQALPFDDNAFDVVVSFQVIEHVPDDTAYLHEIHRVLKAGGKFYCSTPNARVRLLPFQNPWNKYHVCEYSPESFTQKLNQTFSNCELYGLGLKDPWGAMEQKRFNKNKWALFPVTNKLVPNRLRVVLLLKIWNFKQSLKGSKPASRPLADKPQLSDVIITQSNIGQYPNLFAICVKK